MAERIVEARKRSADPKQESLREQKATWNAAVSGFISKLIAFKKAVNGRGDIKAGLPPGSIKNPFSPEVSSYLSGLASEYAEITQAANYIIKSQQEYSMARNQGKKQVTAANDAIIIQASWWGSRLWARMKLRNLPKDIRNIRLEMLRSASYLKGGLDDLEDDFYSSDINKATNAINNSVVLSLGMMNTLANKYNLLVSAYNTTIEDSLGIKKPQEKSPEPKRPAKSKENVSSLPPLEVDPAVKASKEAAIIEKLYKQLPNMQLIIEFIRHDTTIGIDDSVKTKLVEASNKVKSNIYRFQAALKAVGVDETIDMMAFARDIIESSVKLFNTVKPIVQVVADVSSAKDFNDIINILQITHMTKRQERELEEQEAEHRKGAEADIELYKTAANVVSRWINRRLLRMSPTAENDIKLNLTGKIIDVMRLISELLDSLEDEDASINNISKKTMDLFVAYRSFLEKLKVFAKIIYLKQDEFKSTKETPLLRIKSSVFRDIDNIIAQLSIFTNIYNPVF